MYPELPGDCIIGSDLDSSGTGFYSPTDPGIQHRVRQISIPPSIPRQWEDELQASPHSALISPELLDLVFKSNSYYPRRSSDTPAPEATMEGIDLEFETHNAELASQGSAQLINQISSSSSSPIRHSIQLETVTDATYHSFSESNQILDDLQGALSNTISYRRPFTGMPMGSHGGSRLTDGFVDLPETSEDPVGSTQNTVISSTSDNRRNSLPNVLDPFAWNGERDGEKNDDRTSLNSHHRPLDLRLQIPLSFSGCRSMGHRKQHLVQEFCSVVKVLAGLWKDELSTSPEFSCMIAKLCCSSPLQVGLNALRRFLLSNRIPTTISEAFQFASSALACAYLTHTQEGWYPWGVFYQEILRWGQGITDPQDRALYPKVAEFLWSTPRIAVSPISTDWSNMSENQMPMSDSANGNSAKPMQSQATMVDSEDDSSDDACIDLALICQLRDGSVISRCTRYLDG